MITLFVVGGVSGVSLNLDLVGVVCGFSGVVMELPLFLCSNKELIGFE